jgi:predicted adenine nucleotide alpha hydrolase (AANH) superfamily ATPase
VIEKKKSWIVERYLQDAELYDKPLRCEHCGSSRFEMMREHFRETDYVIFATCLRCGEKKDVDLLQPVYMKPFS